MADEEGTGGLRRRKEEGAGEGGDGRRCRHGRREEMGRCQHGRRSEGRGRVRVSMAALFSAKRRVIYLHPWEKSYAFETATGFLSEKRKPKPF